MAYPAVSVLVLLPLLFCVVVSASYNPNQSLNQLYLSYAAYCPTANIEAWNCYWCEDVSGFHVTTTVSNSDTNIFGYIGYSGNVGHVIFRGTVPSSLDNWIDDLDTLDTTVYSIVPGGIVHAGFYDSWNSVKSQVVAGVQSLINQHNLTTIYYSGHSLGAAISLFAALEVGTTHTVPFIVYNFGEPRVGNQIFANYYDTHAGNIFRVVNQEDVVPHLPLEDMGFWHVANEIYYSSSTSYKVCDNTGEDPTCSDGNWVDASVLDHLEYLGISLLDGC